MAKNSNKKKPMSKRIGAVRESLGMEKSTKVSRKALKEATGAKYGASKGTRVVEVLKKMKGKKDARKK